MSYKMIALDLDDTLLRDDLSISNRTKDALMHAQEMGIKVVLASGRPTFGMMPIAKELRLADYGSYIISFNGGKVINCKSQEAIFSSGLSVTDVQKLYTISQREEVNILTYVGDEIITANEDAYTTIESNITGLPVKAVNDFPASIENQVVKVLMVGEPNKLAETEKKLQAELDEEFSVMRSKPYFLEFTEKGVTKATSINELIKRYGIKREEVIAIGDSYNDQEMIVFAGLGVAMDNAPDDIKAVADVVTDSNMNDGVAKIVEEYILNQKVETTSNT
ncbi:Cof-type HAD-IIB family hydrolase [Aquibacillus koreensis]|uniref:Cof-type HAD-IIB family hydrolase n=1 Tax=Aquibacillus koreensis TaxID=279446 RepID=A0A9X3WMG7_9BACI|nr:Cof-type HAD-IIB family hydrolase [Aquibacillus koreensis]MCT2537058.1 Cof-type HAD-IIB family hydrolase [Aquibacillus koreensis]MDC3419959.1 Cof-type HAD-IIB family hydrolase [Aquibacillus koreensis]